MQLRWIGLRGVVAAVVVLAPALGAHGQEARWTPEELEVIELASTGPVGIEMEPAFERWAAGFDASWTYWRMGTDAVRSKGPHMELVRGVIEDGNRVTGFELTPVDVIVRGDTAVLRYNAVETLLTPAGETRDIHYSAVSIYGREDGDWVLLASNLYYPES